MSDFKAKMHQNRFRQGLRHGTRWGSLQLSPDSPVGIKGPTSKGWREKSRREGREMGRSLGEGGGEGGEERERKGDPRPGLGK